MNVFESTSYKNFLNDYIKNAERRGVISELARAAGCTHSYMSQVLNGKPDLTPDQGWALTEYLSLSKEEADYFFTLVLFDRAVGLKLKKSLEAKLKAIRSVQLQTAKVVSRTTDHQIQVELRDKYYSQWSIGAVHTLTASENFQTIENLSKRLSMPPMEIEEHLKWLIESKQIKKVGTRFVHSGQSVHLPTDSIHNRINHLNWRLRSVDSSTKEDEVHYTSTFTISKDDWDALRGSLLKFIDNQRRKIQSSGSEEGYAFCCDLFKI
jgi:uncharacterized protein (TIGR02147 family)